MTVWVTGPAPVFRQLDEQAKELADQVRLMYVGMTRARSRLLITSSESTPFTERLVELVAP